jgi:cytochrome bd-type quinol oxidase subunit 2
MKTTGDLQDRIRLIARLNAYGTVVMLLVVLGALSVVQPSFRRNYDAYPIGYALPLMGLAALVALLVCRAKDHDEPAYASTRELL